MGVLGSGDVDKTLASGFLTHGHVVTTGTHSPAKLADWVKQHSRSVRLGNGGMRKAEAARAIEHCVCCGVSPASSTTSGFTLLRC